MKEEVRDILLPYVMLHIVRIDPFTHGAWPGHAWRAVGPHFMFVSQLQYMALAIRPSLDPIPQPHFPDPQIVDPGYLAQGQQLFDRAGNDGAIEANAVLFHVS